MKKISTAMLAASLTLAATTAVQSSEPKSLPVPPSVYEIQTKVLPADLPCVLYLNHFDVSPQWTSSIALQNLSGGANQTGVYYFSDNATPTGLKELAFTSFQKQAFVISRTEAGSDTGYVIIRSERPIIAFILFGQLETGSTFKSLATVGPAYSFQDETSPQTCAF